MERHRLRVLFVCGRNQWRSPTAAAIYQSDPRLEVRSAGVSPTSRRRLARPDLAWADVVMVMEHRHAERIRANFRDLRLPTIVTLEIEDEFRFMDPELCERLRQAVEDHLARLDLA